MSLAERVRRPAAAVLLVAACAAAQAAEPARAWSPGLGQPVSEAEAARRDLTVFPDGRGLPPGQGTAAQGAVLFARHCAACHGSRGQGGTADELGGGHAPLDGPDPDKNVGNYWPYATTLFDWIRRSMPMTAPGSLQSGEVYALTAYVLFLSGLVGENDVVEASTLPRLSMPNRAGFLPQWPEDPRALEAALRRASAAQAQPTAPSAMDAPWD